MEPTREQLAALARQIASTQPNELDCEAVLDRVAVYLEKSRTDESLAPELRMVGQHLKVCPACHEEFQALVRAMEAE